MIRLCSLASGSSGNAIYIGDGEVHLLVDIGISKKRIEEGLAKISIDANKINGILITHEHSDHIKGLGVFTRKYKVPIYSTLPTWKKILKDKSIGVLDTDLFCEIKPNQSIFVKGIEIHPFSTSHDAADPVCYTFTKDNKKISVATDLGCYDDYILENLSGSNVLFIEANHDIRMLEVGGYPYFLKQRILSDTGHLCNEVSGKLVSEVMNHGLSHVILGHLSKDNNMPEIAYESVRLELAERLLESQHTYQISVAKRDENSELIIIE